MDNEDLNRYELKEGDLIRIGRLCLRIKELKFQNSDKNEKDINLTEINNININDNINNNKYCFTSPINNKSILTPDTRINTNIRNSENNFNNKIINTDLNYQEIQVDSPIKKNNPQFMLLNLRNNSNSNKNISKEEKKEHFCRICYGEEEDEENPLVQPCTCHGSLKYIHLNCLKHWLKTNTYVLCDDNEISKSYKYKEALCELCKSKFPNYIKHKGKLYKIIDFENDFKNYILFDCLTEDKNNNKYLYILSLDNVGNNQLLNIGRGHDANLVIHDASISRNHCLIRISNKKIFLEDCNSKFGTLVLIHSEIIKLTEGLKLYLQIGRSFLKCDFKKSFSFFGCCTISETKNFDFYYKQNKIKFENNNKIIIKTEVDNEEEGKNQIGNESEDKVYNEIKQEENFVTNVGPLSTPKKLKPINECLDENNNEENNSIYIEDRVDVHEERKNN